MRLLSEGCGGVFEVVCSVIGTSREVEGSDTEEEREKGRQEKKDAWIAASSSTAAEESV